MPGTSTPRTARQVIDQAVADNKTGERLLYALAAVFVTVGSFTIIWGVFHGQGAMMGVGAVSSALFWPAMALARRTRKESMCIRVLEAALSKAQTPREATEMLKQLFHEIFHEKEPALKRGAGHS